MQLPMTDTQVDERDESDRFVDTWEKSLQDRDSTFSKLQELGDTDVYSNQDVESQKADQKQKHRSHAFLRRSKR